MPEIAATQTAADMAYAKPHEFMPRGVENRRAARVQAAALRWLVRIAALLTAGVLVFLIGYILVMGIPNLKPALFAWEYNSENVSLMPALINTVLMTAFALAIAVSERHEDMAADLHQHAFRHEIAVKPVYVCVRDVYDDFTDAFHAVHLLLF